MKKIFFLALSLSCIIRSNAQNLTKAVPFDSVAFSKNKSGNIFTLKNTALATAFTTYGFLRPYDKGIRNLDYHTRYEVLEDHHGFSTHIDDYLQWLPTVSNLGLHATPLKTAHNFKQLAAREGISILVMSAFLYPLKHFTAEMRPDNSNNNSFPSGHTTNAFRGAEILHLELKDKYPVWSYSGYAVAAATGALRVYNNRHWVSDVVTGAGLGILSAKFTYWMFEKPWKRKSILNPKN